MTNLPGYLATDVAEVVATLPSKDGQRFSFVAGRVLATISGGRLTPSPGHELRDELAGWYKFKFDLVGEHRGLAAAGLATIDPFFFPRWRVIYRPAGVDTDVLAVGYRNDIYKRAPQLRAVRFPTG